VLQFYEGVLIGGKTRDVSAFRTPDRVPEKESTEQSESKLKSKIEVSFHMGIKIARIDAS
jgi:hypothetical protein